MSITQTHDGEVIGEKVNVCIDGVMSVFQSRMRNILDDHGIEKPDPEPDEWYPVESFIQVLTVVEEDVGKNALTKIGEATPAFVAWPTSPESPGEALESLLDMFEKNHRNVDGGYSFDQTGDTTARITSTTPYPEAWEEGMIKGTAEEHGSSYARVNVVDGTPDDKKQFEVEW